MVVSREICLWQENLNSSPEGLILCTEMVPPMVVNVLCTMGSPRPVPPLLRALPLVNAVEALKQVRYVLLGHSASVVGK